MNLGLRWLSFYIVFACGFAAGLYVGGVVLRPTGAAVGVALGAAGLSVWYRWRVAQEDK